MYALSVLSSRSFPPSSNPWSVPSYPSNASSSSQARLPFIQSSSSLAIALGDPYKTNPVRTPSEPRSSAVLQHNKRTVIPSASSQQPPVPVIPDSKIRPSTPPPHIVPEFKTPIKPSASAFDSNFSSPDPLAIQPTAVGAAVSLNSTLQLPNTSVTSSPDPLALLPNLPYSVTPRKRKPVPLNSPTLKRAQSGSFPTIPIPRHNSQSSVSSTSSSLTPGGTIRPTKRFLGVEIPPPPKGFSTPSTSGRSKSIPSSGDLGGFSPPESEWDEADLTKRSASKSSGKRTGDRDDRSMRFF